VPRATGIAAGTLAFFSFIPGLPKIPFIMMSAIFGMLFYLTRKESMKTEVERDLRKQQAPKMKDKEESEEDFEALLQVDRMGIEVGYKLVNFVDPKRKGGVLSRIGTLRKQLVRELGVIIPPIRLRDNLQLNPNEYNIKIKGQTVAKGELIPDSLLALGGDGQKPIEGVITTDPAYGLPSIWIGEEKKEEAMSLGYTVIDPTSVLMTHLTEIVKSHSHEIVTREDIQKLIDNLKKVSPTLVSELTPNVLALSVVQEVIRNLLRERASIRDFSTILETLIDYAPITKDPEALTECVRQRLCRTLCGQYQDDENKISTITFEPRLEQEIVNSIQETGNKSVLALEPTYAQRIIDAISTTMKKPFASGSNIVFLTSSTIRNHVRKLTENPLPYLPVLSYKEIAPGIQIESLGVVSITNEN
jgi:flagellar biosynthesis protein FlhA